MDINFAKKILRGVRYLIAGTACLLLWQSAIAGSVVTSPNDSNEYETFVLENGLKVLLVSDSSADKAAASLDVYIGSGSDPEDREGLAHFLEHMLFLGNKKYPKAGEYQSFISSHGGQNNAFTSYSHTNYFFDVDADYLEPALDRFAQFFIAPLFNEQFVQRERAIVHSEFESRRKNDFRRTWEAQKEFMNPKHPQAGFSVGSRETLADRENDSVRDALIKFYEKHYSANIMTLAIVGKEDLTQLKKWAVEKFAAVKNTNASPLRTNESLYSYGTLPAQLNVIPEKESRSLTMTFPIPPFHEHYRTKPLSYISNILGHEGQGSLLAKLKNAGWAEGLSAGPRMAELDTATMAINIGLTPEGVNKTDKIVDLVFQQIELIRDKGVKEWLFNEQKVLADVSFQFIEESSAIGYARRLASLLQEYPAEEVLKAPYLYENFDADVIDEYLSYLTPNNMLLTLVAPGQETDTISQWYETPYKVSGISDRRLRQWTDGPIDKELAIPAPNEFIPEDLALKKTDEAQSIPVRLDGKNGLEFWFQNDASFRTPRASLYVNIRSPVANNSARHAVLTQLYVDHVLDVLDEFAYPARLADLEYDIYKHVRGITIRLSGFNDKLDVLLARIIDSLGETESIPENFALNKQELLRNLRNANKDTPYQQMYQEVRSVLLDPDWSEQTRIDAAEPLNADDLKAFVPQLFEQINVAALAHGNFDQQDTENAIGILEDKLLSNSEQIDVPSAQVVRLQSGKRFVRELEVEHNDSAVVIYFQGDDKSYHNRALFYLLAQVLESPFYFEIRTTKQLGYVVFASPLPIMDVPGLAFIVQSPTASASKLIEEIETFMSNFDVSKVSQQDFDAHKQALLTQILQSDKRLSERSNRYWTEIDSKEYEFDSREKLAAALREVKLDEFQSFYSEVLLNKPGSRLIVQSNGENHDAGSQQTNSLYIDDVAAFKADKDYFPRF
ncbi:MAG: insulinase family protein [Gammaproteobacteria bacterium]|nr:insulinase family protein [Gammaproteobacteria bacterium]